MSDVKAGLRLRGFHTVEIARAKRAHPLTGAVAADGFTYMADGEILPEREVFGYENLFVNTGLDALLGYFTATSPPATLYGIALSATPVVAATDTMASHAGWTEFTNYNEAARQEWVDGTVASQAISNTASKIVITSTSDSNSVGGMGLTTVSTKGGTTGVLLCASAFDSNKAVDTGDTLTVTIGITASDDPA